MKNQIREQKIKPNKGKVCKICYSSLDTKPFKTGHICEECCNYIKRSL